MFSLWSYFYESFARFSSQLVSMYCHSFLLFFLICQFLLLTVGVFGSLRISSFLTCHRAFTILLSIFDCGDSSLFIALFLSHHLSTTMRTDQLHSSVLRDATHAHTPTRSYSYLCITTTRLIRCSTQNYISIVLMVTIIHI